MGTTVHSLRAVAKFGWRGAFAACMLTLWAGSGCGKAERSPGVAPMSGTGGAEQSAAGAGGYDGVDGGTGGLSSTCAAAVCGNSESDACCPQGCDALTDLDCRVEPGGRCVVDAECASMACTDASCCTGLCGVCEECTGVGGSCIFVPIRREDEDGGCFGENWCDGRGACKPKAQVTAGGHTCALLANGNARCWGRGVLGYGHSMTIGDDEAPAVVGDVQVGGTVVQLAAGWGHTCAVLSSGGIRCWGNNTVGQLGVPGFEAIGDDEVPAASVDVALGASALQVVTGGGDSCALLEDGSVRCWGYGVHGQLGYPVTIEGSPPGLATVGEPVVELAAGRFHTCALLAKGRVRCWGSNSGGQLGYPDHDGDIGDDESPASAGDLPLDAEVVQIAAGAATTCVLLSEGAVRCWGDGRKEPDDLHTNLKIGGKVKQLAVGGGHACALLTEGNVRCWGGGTSGQLGYGNENDIRRDQLPPPRGDVDVGGKVVQLAAGVDHTCALLDDGNIRCWGLNDFGQLGHGNTKNIGDDETPASAGNVPYR